MQSELNDLAKVPSFNETRAQINELFALLEKNQAQLKANKIIPRLEPDDVVLEKLKSNVLVSSNITETIIQLEQLLNCAKKADYMHVSFSETVTFTEKSDGFSIVFWYNYGHEMVSTMLTHLGKLKKFIESFNTDCQSCIDCIKNDINYHLPKANTIDDIDERIDTVTSRNKFMWNCLYAYALKRHG